MPTVLKAATSRKRNVTKGLAKAVNFAARKCFIDELTELHSRAHRLGLHATGHAMHKAVQIVGYEVAGHLDAMLKNKDGTA